MTRQQCLQNSFSYLNIAGFSELRLSTSWEEVNIAGFSELRLSTSWEEVRLVAGDPAYSDIQQRLSEQPAISVRSITFDGADDGVNPAKAALAEAHQFSGRRDHRVLEGAGHNLPQEKPHVFANAVLELVCG